MTTLRVRLFGRMEIDRGGAAIPRLSSRKAENLFAYLALEPRRRHPREVLADLFWPEHDASAARKRLRTELWLLRKNLEEDPKNPKLLYSDSDSVGLHPEADLWVDVEAFETDLDRAESRSVVHRDEATESTSPPRCRRLERATALYRGDLLEGLYQSWCLEARECLQGRYVEALHELVTLYLDDGCWRLAIAVGQRLLRHDPLDEQAHRGLMLGHFAAGNRAAAMRQYSRCAALLRRELDVEPMHETSALLHRIKHHRGPAIRHPGVAFQEPLRVAAP